MSMILEDTSCCGLKEIPDLSERPQETLRQVCLDKYGDEWDDYNINQAFILFTDTVDRGNGEKLAKFIKKHKLGVVYETTRAKKNPNTGNMLKVWVWSPHERNLKKWFKEVSK